MSKDTSERLPPPALPFLWPAMAVGALVEEGVALAALIFGKWKPYPTLGACLLFAFTDALATRLQGVDLPLVGVIPVQFILALPYVLTVLLLAGFVGTAVPPAAIGVPYAKEK